MKTFRAFIPILALLDLAAILIALVAACAVHSSHATPVKPVRHPAVTWDGKALHYSPTAFRSSCAPLSLVITYDDGEEAWHETFKPCQTAYFVPADPTHCTIERWKVSTASAVYGKGWVPSCVQP